MKKALPITLLAAFLLLCAVPAGALSIDLPPADVGLGIWHDFDTGANEVVATTSVKFAQIKGVEFSAMFVLPTNLERLNFGEAITVKIGSTQRLEFGAGFRDWGRDPGLILRYSF